MTVTHFYILNSSFFNYTGVRKTGVYANGRVVVVTGKELDAGVYELCIDRIEKTENCEPLPIEKPEDFARIVKT